MSLLGELGIKGTSFSIVLIFVCVLKRWRLDDLCMDDIRVDDLCVDDLCWDDLCVDDSCMLYGFVVVIFLHDHCRVFINNFVVIVGIIARSL